MTKTANLLAFDLGAESGRAVLGSFDGERLQLTEIHRFPNGPVRALDNMYWDVLRLFQEMKAGLAKAAAQKPAGIGIDTWGVDSALLDAQGALVATPYHYRDPRTDGMLERVTQRISRQEIFDLTGIQFMEINTICQLYALALQHPKLLAAADTFLMIPDLFNYWFTGQKVCEFTGATTTQLYDPRAREWAKPIFDKLGLPLRIMPTVVQPGAILGPLLPGVCEETGLGKTSVIAPACHDTGSAVVAVPASGDDFLYLSAGTWTLPGVELKEPLINAAALEANYTNEGGAGGTFRFLKNIVGLWLVQECRREWAHEGTELSYDEITRLAAAAKPLVALVNPDHADFLRPGGMPQRIQAYCRDTGQPVPEERGAIVRCALESLALRFRGALEQIETLTGRHLRAIHMVGGGCKNELLNQFTADATGRPVFAGPVEATASGNIIVQAIALGYLGSIQEGRDLVRRSIDLKTYEPRDTARWDEAYERFGKLPA